MAHKFANAHSLSQDVEITTRSAIAERAGYTSVVHDGNSHTLKRDLDNMLRDTWADALAETFSPGPPRAKKHQKTTESRIHEDGQLAFRLVSSMKCPQPIFLEPKPPSLHAHAISRAPDCEDDAFQAETRRLCALSVSVELARLRESAVSTWQIDSKPVTVTTKVLATTPLVRPLPSFLVTEEARAGKTVRRVKTGNPQASESSTASPHESRPSCVVLPVMSVPDHRKIPGKKHRKSVKERPLPAYWRPSPELRGKCMGYGLGYPSSWAPDRLYVRDAMKRGVESTLTCHAVHDTLKSE